MQMEDAVNERCEIGGIKKGSDMYDRIKALSSSTYIYNRECKRAMLDFM